MGKIPQVYILSPNELRKLQLELLDMLIELDRVCKKNNIRYALDGGTLLGAVRHKGFIPWDDDIDVVMLREDYDRFRDACLRDLNAEKYFYQDHTTDPYYRWGYARIRRTNSEFVRVGQEHMKMQTGIFLDIFPRDNVPDSPLLRPVHNICCFFLRKILYSEVGRFRGKNMPQRLVYRLIYLIPRDSAFRLHDKLAALYNRKNTVLSRTIAFPILPHKQYGYSREWFENVADIEFEGHVFSGVKDHDGYLSCLYGDYMTLPPENMRHWHPVSKFQLPEDS